MLYLLLILLVSVINVEPSCYMESNILSCTKEVEDVFGKMLTTNKNIKKIFWVHSTIENLYQGIFGTETTQFENMYELIMTADVIESISCSVFKRFSNLILLDLSFNQIKQLKQCYLQDITKLQILELSNNLIDNLQLSLANVTPKLTRLDLSYNKIETIPNIFLENLFKLHELDISYNRLKSLSNIFGTLSSLKRLYINLNLKGNEIKVDPETFIGLNNLSEFSYNKTQFLFRSFKDPFRYLIQIPIRKIKVNQFLKSILNLNDEIFGNHFQNYSEIDLSQLGIETIEFQTNHDFNQLKSISLSENRLKTVTSSMLKYFHTVKFMNLSMNEIESFGNDTFYGFLQLEILDLSFNRIQKLSRNQWIGLNELLELKLQTNLIETISDDCFHDLINLNKLDLSDNLLINISLKIFEQRLNILQVLNFALNPIQTIRTEHSIEKIAHKIIISSDIDWKSERERNEFFEFCLLHYITLEQIQPEELEIIDNENINFKQQTEPVDNYELKLSPKFNTCLIFIIILYILCISLPTWVYIQKRKGSIYDIPIIRFVNQKEESE